MAYSKNQDPWADSDLVTTTVMDNLETIYTEASSYLAAHTHDALYPTKAEMEAAYWYAGNDGSGSGSDADLIYKSTGNLHASSFAGMGIPTGLVILWYGAVSNIPAGWHLCDGTAGTINLLNKFVVGAGTGSAYSPGDTGGSATFTAAGTMTISSHALTLGELPAHTHTFTDTYGVIPGGNEWTYGGGGGSTYTTASSSSGTSSSAGSGTAHGHSAAEGTGISFDAVACLPFYYSLAYIQKI